MSTARARIAGEVVAVTVSSLTVNRNDHAGITVNLNRAAGIAVTLPAAVGSGSIFRFVVGATITSNTTTIKVVGNDVMAGLALQSQDGGNTVQAWETAADSDTITLDGSTTGGLLGDSIELIDVAADTWWVRVVSAATGTEATPFSATVS